MMQQAGRFNIVVYPSKHGIAICVIACDFIAEHLGKPASCALKYFEPII